MILLYNTKFSLKQVNKIETTMERRSNSDGGNDGGHSNAMHNNDKKERRSDSPPANEKRTQKKKTKHTNVSSTALAVATTTNSAPSSSKWTNTPISLLIRTLGYLDNASLIAMCLVCKQICTIIQDGHGMDNQLVRLFELRCTKDWSYSRFYLSMTRYFEDENKTRILQGLQHLKVYDVHKFGGNNWVCPMVHCDSLNVRMTGIVSLDISSPLSISGGNAPNFSYHLHALPRALSYMLPNLQQLDCSHTRMNKETLGLFVERCPRLEIIKRNNIPDGSIDHDHLNILADGYNLRMTSNLKEIYFDNCFFEFVDEFEEGEDIEDDEDMEYAAMTNLKKYPKLSLLYLLCKDNSVLERVSMRNARRSKLNNPQQTQTVLPQDALIKFVRNAPSTLNWFRSDLSAANIQVLQLEKPGIQFLN